MLGVPAPLPARNSQDSMTTFLAIGLTDAKTLYPLPSRINFIRMANIQIARYHSSTVYHIGQATPGKYVDRLEWKQKRRIRGMDTKPHEERVRDLGKFSLEERGHDCCLEGI